jgi:hypothetical protein
MAKPAPSSHCENRVLMLCAGTLLPRRHKCVARTAAVLSLAITHPHACEQGFCNFPASFTASRFAKVLASRLTSLSTESTKGVK